MDPLQDRRSINRRLSSNSTYNQTTQNSLSDRRILDRRTQFVPASNRRFNPRITIEFPLTISFDSSSHPIRSEKISVNSLNICINGLRIYSKEKLPLSNVIKLSLILPDVFIPIQSSGSIVWRRFDSQKRVFQYGIMLRHSNLEYLTILQLFINKKFSSKSILRSRLWQPIENFLYQKILRNLIYGSRLGYNSLNAMADSGLNFDHIYRNLPEGVNFTSKFIDKLLLGLPAAQATRKRKENIVSALRFQIQRNKLRGLKTRIVDLGSGPARYIHEVLNDKELIPFVEAVCIDSDKQSTQFGKSLATDKPIRYLKVNIFRLSHLFRLSDKLKWQPNLIIASGLIYYLDDDEVKQLFRKVSERLAPGGQFLLSNLVNNPNKKLIGKLFVTMHGSPWIPIARPPALVRSWLIDQGFEQLVMTTDRWGMYSLILCQNADARSLSSPRKSANGMTIRTLSKTSRTFEFRNNGVTFSGHIFSPNRTTKVKGTVIFIHGLGYCGKSYQIEPNELTSAGYIYFTFDLRGHAGTAGEWTLNSSIEDIKKGIRYACKTFEEIESHPIGIIAHSTGALIGLLATQEQPLINFASLISPVTSIYDSFMHWHQSGFNQAVKPFFQLNGKVPPIIENYLDDYHALLDFKDGRRPREELKFPYRYGMLRASSFLNLSDAIAYSPDLINQVDKINFPVIVFRSENDEVMPTNKIETFFQKVPSKIKRLINTQAPNHFQNTSWPLIISESIHFFDSLYVHT